ncbi:MurR/RpiR family transcriptional regulator [Celeribacter halophilus]|uniref:Transcriptional regulator, RpiR family n=1 Tax=Celeribacter halophilus TaxID=576117 RepID=A0A1I3W499_9RHOB|nr:MurR/RpiR family transcriptional regulator [Celeribacter halophilus]PZX09910.1 RpiR family transcriptional regulator [Celeribacter halophilus]SFK02023.1 transcriptional regulator, RpiR family [Celeribacter halophilus]
MQMKYDDSSDEAFEALREQIAEDYEGLSKRLKLIADFSLQDPSAIALNTAASLGEEIGVAPSALVRFAKHFGFSGFSEMQAIFRDHLQVSSTSYKERIHALAESGATRDTGEMTDRFIEAGIASLRDLQHSISPEHIETAAKLMADARIVHILAQKRTFTAATYLAYNLSRLDVPANLLDGLGGTLEQQMVTVSPEDTVVAISFNPSAGETVEAFERARDIGARTIVITDLARAPFIHADSWFQISEASVDGFRSLNATISLALILAIRAGTMCAEMNTENS